MQYLRFITPAVPDILVGPCFSFSGLVSLNINSHAKFEVCVFSRSRDIRGSQNLKSTSRDHGHALFFQCFIFPSSVRYDQSAYNI